MNILIYGAGAIGSHLAYCLQDKKNKIILLSKRKYINQLNRNGLNLKIFSNKQLKKSVLIKNNNNIKFEYKVSRTLKFLKNKIDVIFVTLKLKDFNFRIQNKIKNLSHNKTLLVLPCTYLPPWWFIKVFKTETYKKKLPKEIRIFRKHTRNMIGMTMWLSGNLEKPGYVKIKHIQRGYPLKEIHHSKKFLTAKLRNTIRKKCLSPVVKNIYSEVYIKSINSFAFNLVALQTEQNNYNLKKNIEAIKNIKKVLTEFDNIVLSLGLPIYQSINSRIRQTLSSTKHTLSMLTDFKRGKKVEIRYVWSSLLMLSKLSKKDITFSKSIYKIVLKKLKKNGNLG